MQKAEKRGLTWQPNLLLFAMLLGGSITFTSYPGVFYTDSLARAKRAAWIAGRSDWRELNAYLTVVPQFFMAAVYKITNNHATWTWLQATFFLWAILQFIWYFFPKRSRIVMAVLLMACPIIAGYSVYWEMSVVMTGALLWFLMVEDSMDQKLLAGERLHRGWNVLYGFISFVIVGFRINAVTAIAGVWLWDMIRPAVGMRKERFKALAPRLVAGAVGVVMALSFPWLMRIRSPSNMAYGFFWESLCIIDEVGGGNGCDTYYDDLLGEGTTRTVFDAEAAHIGQTKYFEWDTYNYMTSACPKQVYKRYIMLVLHHPLEFLKVKMAFIVNNLRTLSEKEYGSNLDLSEMGVSDTPQRRGFLKLTMSCLEAAVWLRTPWLMFLLATGFALASWRVTGQTSPAAKWVFAAMCYYGAFFITSQSFEYRYFFPADLILVLASLYSLLALILHLWRRYKTARWQGRGRQRAT